MTKKVKVRGEEFDLEEKDALLIITIQDLTQAIERARFEHGR